MKYPLVPMEQIEAQELDALAERTNKNTDAQNCEALRHLLRKERLMRAKERRAHKKELAEYVEIVSTVSMSIVAVACALILPPWTAFLPVLGMAWILKKLR